jgi:hypothetical protein
MIRQSEPQYSFEQTLDECIAGITGNIELKRKLICCKSDLIAVENQYLVVSGAGDLFTILPFDTHEDDPIVISALKKSQLIKIYEQYFAKQDKPARKIYDSLLNAAKEKCPFCGGIGTPRNLDHFLPKTHFPQFSVLPRNLVPSCRDCNMDGKAHSYAKNAEEQIIQPYTDNDRFFLEQWIFADYHANDHEEPGEFEYYVLPPKDWTMVDKQRVEKHFADFNLAKRYATKAAEHLATVLLQIERMRRSGLDSADIRSIILQPGADKALFINHWQKGMYQALIHTLC